MRATDPDPLFLRKVLLFSGIHFAAILAALLLALMDSSMDEGEAGWAGRAGSAAFEILTQPGLALWLRYGDGASDSLEWALFVGNSLLWGVALTWLWNKIRQPGRGQSVSASESS